MMLCATTQAKKIPCSVLSVQRVSLALLLSMWTMHGP